MRYLLLPSICCRGRRPIPIRRCASRWWRNSRARPGFGKVPPGAITEDAVIMLEAMKTGALIRAACGMGAILGKASESARKALDFYGYALGQAFQIADDLLDLEGDPKTVGKKTKKDAAAGKATFIGILGVDGARARLATLVATAEAALDEFGEKAAMLRAAARFVAERKA
jgi:farnesyl diphosphate synthase